MLGRGDNGRGPLGNEAVGIVSSGNDAGGPLPQPLRRLNPYKECESAKDFFITPPQNTLRRSPLFAFVCCLLSKLLSWFSAPSRGDTIFVGAAPHRDTGCDPGEV